MTRTIITTVIAVVLADLATRYIVRKFFPELSA